MCIASALLSLAARQQNHYYEMLERSHALMEPDYAYNPPARLAALLICGPGTLVPVGAHVYVPSIQSRVVSVIAVSIFWFWLGWMVDRKVGGRGPVIRSPLPRAFTYLIFLAPLGLLGWKLLDQLRTFIVDPAFPMYMKQYGVGAVVLLDFGAALWLLGAFGFCSSQIVASLQHSLRSHQ